MNFTQKSVLITGGTGSFGNKFAEYLIKNTDVRRVIIYSRDEYKQFVMSKYFGDDERLRFFIGDVRDEQRLRRAFSDVDYVVHAAAMKQVPACEYNPIEAVRTNVDGAANVINAALDMRVKRVIALSTDKAVNPINLYGGTKLVSDKLFISANSYSGSEGCKFALVRYGNVAGSRGSVIPFFKNLITAGAVKLPVTDERMTRFYMTLDGAVSLVIKAIESADGGETFVYKNPSFYIKDLAEVMIGERKYEVVGIREGEKLHECMITADDSRSAYEYDGYYIIYPNLSWYKKRKTQSPLISGGIPVPAGWSYTSDNNSKWLNKEELKRVIHSLTG